jgi:membrane-associated PAP2 superfamily phosphatase
VLRLEPLRYEGAIAFDALLELAVPEAALGSLFPAAHAAFDGRE